MVKASKFTASSGAKVVSTYLKKIQAKMPTVSTPIRHSVPTTLKNIPIPRRMLRFFFFLVLRFR